MKENAKASNCPECSENELEKGEEICHKCASLCPLCGGRVDADTNVCFTCKEVVR